MKLKKIEIVGFKSFADRIYLNFHEGMTAVVGPNGCGKSNISDAFRWVLGEQSAKSMRGGKMADVIFAGTSTRKPLNFAEVTITLSEIQGQLDTEFEEISVTRRLHRSGESEYLLNGHPIRLKDLQLLFLDSGIGKDAYSFFEQGEMDQIIHNSPYERRYIFEEAAGILRFLQRKKEALRKLDQADYNTARVKDIHGEVEKRIQILKEQAEKARNYKENKARVEELEKAIFLTKGELFQKKKQDLHQMSLQQASMKENLQASYQECRKNLADAKHNLNTAENDLKAKNEQVFQARSDKEIKGRERQAHQERLKEALTKEKRWLQELEGMHAKRTQRELEQQQAQAQKKKLEIELSGQENILKALREKTHQLEGEVNLLRDRQQTVQREQLQFVHVENQIESELKQLHIRLDSGRERMAHSAEKKERLKAQQTEISHQALEKERKLHEISRLIDEQKLQYEEKDKVLSELNLRIQKQHEQQAKLQKEMTEQKARQKVLNKLKEAMEGFSEGSKKLLKESANSKSPIYQKLKGLYEYIIPPKGQELAVSTLIKPYAQTLVTETTEDLQKVAAFAKKNNIKEFSLLSLEVIESSKGSVVDLPYLLEPQNSLIDHFFKAVCVSADYEEACSLSKINPGSQFWLEEGAHVDGHQVLFFSVQGENNVFMRQAELKELENTLKDLESSLTELELQLQESQQNKTQVYAQRMELDKAMRKNEMNLVEANFAVQRLKGDLEALKREESTLDKESESISLNMTKWSQAVGELEQKHQKAKSTASTFIAQTSSLNQELEVQAKTLKLEQRTLQEKEAAFHQLNDENRKLLHHLHVLEVKDLESQQQEVRLEQEIRQWREIQEQMNAKGHEYEKIIQGTEKQLKDATFACTETEKALALQKKQLESMEAKANDIWHRIKKAENEEYQTGVQLAQLNSFMESLETELQERYGMTLPQLKQAGVAAEKSVEPMEKQVRLLKNEMEAAGDINMTSIEEFKQQQERYHLLDRELDDMNGSRQELLGIIDNLNEESRKQFKLTYEQIKANFKKNFSILFNGGEASLEFTDSSDILEAGIEIIAKPPGKQMRSIQLLSGGEKCLTAMALLFAIFEVKPSPFCVLDEIDAPLDDSNVERFVNLLKQFIDRSQFIVITHNKRTMAVADILFGVSMEEKGVSKVLSLEFAAGAAI